MNIIKKIICGIIAFSLLLSVNSLAIEFGFVNDNSQEITEEKVQIIEEDPNVRGEFERHYFMSDGSMMATTFTEQVYYRDGENWIEIDNSFTLEDGKYRSANKAFPVSLSKDARSDSLISISHNDKTISWTYYVEGEKQSKIGISEMSTLDILETADTTRIKGQTISSSNKSISQLVSSNLFGQNSSIDIVHEVVHNKISEKILINKKTDLSVFYMEIDNNGLDTLLNEDGSVSFYEGNNELFKVSYSNIMDANNIVSGDIDVTMTEEDDKSIIILNVPNEWISDENRAFPISINSVITTSEYRSNIQDTYVHQTDDSENHSGETKLVVGNYNGKTHRAFINIPFLPSIPYNSTIFYSRLNLFLYTGTNTGGPFTINRVFNQWDASSIRYSNQPYCEPIVSNIPFDNRAYGDLEFDITTTMTRYYNGNFSYYGFMLQYSNESLQDYNYFYSSEYSNSNKHPVLTILYNPAMESENNNTMATANEILIANESGHDSYIEGLLSSMSDVDYYTITPLRHGRVMFKVMFPNGYYNDMVVLDSSGNEISVNDVRREANTVTYSFKTYRGTQASYDCENYYIKIFSGNSPVSSNQYRLTVFYEKNYSNLNWQYPLNPGIRVITSAVGHREFSVNGVWKIDYHRGIDIGGTSASEIVSACDGTVEKAQYNSSMGNYITIKSDDVDAYTGENYMVTYMHLSEIYTGISANTRVIKGQPIGKTGNTGESYGEHLHFEVNDQNETYPSSYTAYINPVDLFDDVGLYGDVFGGELG